MNELFNAGLITLGAVATSMVSRKLLKNDLGVSNTTQRMLKLAAAVEGGSVLVKYLQKKDYIPDEPFKDKLKYGKRSSRSTIQRNSLCRSRIRVSQVRQKWLRSRDGKTQHSNPF